MYHVPENVYIDFFSAAPEAPTNLNVKDKKDTSVTLTWKAPKQDGGAKIEAYHIVKKEDNGDWNDLARIKALDTEHKVLDLVPGKSYHFRVEAENEIGRGDAVETSTPVVLKKTAGQ